jgi:hypothetical protein
MAKKVKAAPKAPPVVVRESTFAELRDKMERYVVDTTTRYEVTNWVDNIVDSCDQEIEQQTRETIERVIRKIIVDVAESFACNLNDDMPELNVAYNHEHGSDIYVVDLAKNLSEALRNEASCQVLHDVRRALGDELGRIERAG